MEKEKEFIAAVLLSLEECQVQVSKVLLQKFIYFLDTQGIQTNFRFEPYTYGPYSFGLTTTLNSMSFWDEIKEDREKITILDLKKYNIDSSLIKSIKEKFFIFQEIVGDLTFSNLECTGTILYCAYVLANYGEQLTEEALTAEFKAWKKNRYSDHAIHSAYEKIKSFLPRPC